MKLTELLTKDTPSLSFEVFPPKTDDAFDTVHPAVCEIAKLKPAFMSVTYGAGGGTSQYTKDVCTALSAHGVVPLAHLTCYSSDKEKIHTELESLREKGIETTYDEVLSDMRTRDHNDRSRTVAPAVAAPDATLFDNSGMSPDECTAAIIQLIKEKAGV